MVTEVLKSLSITNLDATPVIQNTGAEGAQAYLKSINDFLTPTSGKTNGSVYRFVRIPSYARVKSLTVAGGAQTVGKYDWGLYHSDSTTDGTPATKNNGTIINSDSLSYFASDYSFASAVNDVDITNLRLHTPAQRNKPMWQAVGLATDPSGFFDVAATLRTDLTTGAIMGVAVEFAI